MKHGNYEKRLSYLCHFMFQLISIFYCNKGTIDFLFDIDKIYWNKCKRILIEYIWRIYNL